MNERKRQAGQAPSQADDVDSLLSYAFACHQAGHLADAEQGYRKVLARRPKHFDSLHLLGVIHFTRGAHLEALRYIDLALKINPDVSDAHANRALALRGLNRPQEALASCERAIALNSARAEPFNTRAAILIELRCFEDALASCEQALALKPDYAEAISNRGNALKELKRHDEALANYDKAIALRADFADAHNNRANVLNRLERFTDALPSARRAVELKPGLAEAHLNLGTALLGLTRYKESVESFERAMTLDPEIEHLRGGHLHAKMLACHWTGFEDARSRLVSAVADGKPAISPFQLLPCSSDLELQLRCAERYASKYVGTLEPLWRGEVYSHQRIRVAYLSSDFRDHPVSLLTVGLFEAHDRSRFETTAISFIKDAETPIGARVRAAFDHFVDAQDMSSEDVATLLRKLEIDVVVDLNGYTDGGRPEILSRRPAPVQVNFLGYPGSLGHPAWDYIIADPFVIPEGSRPHYSEQVVYLPDCFMPTDRKRKISVHTPSRLEAGLPENGLVFCSFNNSYKIIPEIFDVWARLLRQVEGSVLWLSAANADAVDNLRSEAAARGIAPERLIFANRVPLNEDHLARLRLADLFLDTPCYNAHATAADALWVGVPVVTCAGSSFASRVAGSLLHAAGLPELIAESLADYEQLALRLAGDPMRLRSLRDKLARSREAGPLFDTVRFTRHLEAAYTTMWQRTQRGEKPQGFAVAQANEAAQTSRESPRLSLTPADFQGDGLDKNSSYHEAHAGREVVPPPDGIKLHIGGQQKREGWKILDALPGPIVDYVGNCNDLSFLPDDSCSEVYASHVLEHLGYDSELPKTLGGIHRVLKSGGRLRVSVPDLDTLCRLFVDPSLDFAGRFHVMRMMFGGRMTDYDVHYVGYNFEILAVYLHQTGFRDIRRVEGFGVFNDTSTLRFGDVPISLNVEARK